MKKTAISVVVLAGTMILQAADAPKVKETALLSGGVISGQLKAMYIISDKDNGWAPNNGSGYLGTLKYVTPEVLDGLKFGAAFYVNGDTGLTDWDGDKKNALGMFTNVEGDEKSLLGEVYLEYKNDKFRFKGGRQILNTPLTQIKWSLMPNFYEAYMLGAEKVNGFSFELGYISRMSYGSRAATDWGLIGEKTKTAGVARPMETQSATGIAQAEFHDLAEGAGVNEDTNGMTVAGATYTGIKGLKVSLWDYYAWDIANMLYADVDYKFPVAKGTNLALSAQYLQQDEIGDKLAGTLNYSLTGVKANIGNKKWSVYAAYNKSNDEDNDGNTLIKSGFLNAWGTDPAYTSSLFSRNAYRQDVSAYKVGGHYTIMKGLKLMASYANYGKSKTTGYAGLNLVASNDATETDIILAYKPTKAWTIKVFNAIRTSEYDSSAVVEKKMNHFRVIASYNF
ncbi:OprD family porin [Sulfurovum sp. XGS-02]|uniref:OprD family outer membrane porin n=1 Tax=Sulfurovum sp. XGS-02 TaxID=2925411 RepID=UPI0020687485|nr:OprD family outer membrane porin [Sulfurovum sp. XGS-02]UPT76937.1 OprD family porin [Sulfurovum sp. XGS-02]